MALWALSSCSGPGTQAGPLRPTSPSPRQATLPPGLLTTSPDRVDFLSLLQAGASFTGTDTFYEYSATSTGHVISGTEPVTGLIQGTSVQMTVGQRAAWTAVLGTDGALTAEVPQADGSIATAVFNPAGISDYNAAIAPIQARVAQWSTSYWGTQAAKACSLTVGYHDVRVFVSQGGGQVCTAAPSYGYTVVTTYVQAGTVICVGTAGGVTVAVAYTGGQYYGGIACQDIKAGTFPSVAQGG